MGRDDLDLYGSGVDGARIVRGFVRTVVALAGGALAAYGLALYALRCFDTCPSDPSLDSVLQVLPAAVVLTGLAVVVEAITFRTRWARRAGAVVAILGALVAVCGVASLAVLPSVDRDGGGIGGLVVSAVVVLLVGAAFVIAHRPRGDDGAAR